MKAIYIILGLFGTVLFTGCSSGRYLVYNPVIETCSENNISIAVDVKDSRIDKDEIGYYRGEYGPVLLTVNNSVSDWVTEALNVELQNAGYKTQKNARGATLYTVKGKVLSLRVNTDAFSKEGKLRIDVEVFKKNKMIFQKEYFSRMNPKADFTLFKDSSITVLEELLQNICSEFIGDLEMKT